MRRVPGALMAALLLGASGQAALAQAPLSIEVSVDCYSSPESVTITNVRAKPITVKAVGSTYQRRAGEPYKVKKVLRPGRSVTYTFGSGKGGKRLSGSFILDNQSSREAVLVKTNKGRVKVKCTEGTNVPPEPDVTAPTDSSREVVNGQPVDALDLLATLPVRPEVEGGYERQLFRHWVDEDGDGCDTRQEVLIAESLTPVTLGDGCRVEEGTWFSTPDDDTLTNPSTMDINHTVPLKEAWASGAYAWSLTRREEFANDLRDERTLQAVSAGANRQQGESDPATWLPVDRDVACQFVTDWVAIKATWGLSVDETELEAIETTLQSCSDRVVTAILREPETATASE